MKGNILGVPPEQWVSDEIARRQLIHGTGIDGSQRDALVLNYLNNRSPWIKLASGVSLNSTTRLTDVTKNDVGAGITTAIAQNYTGKKLAENFVLFNTFSALEGESYAFRSGVKKSKAVLDLLAQYGGIGSVNQGLQPTPGLIDATVTHVNRGSIKKAKVKIKAYNKIQFAIVELLYLRLGYTIMLEWGWDKNSSTLGDLGSTIIEKTWFKGGSISQTQMLADIETLQHRYSGNYGGFFGKVSNFTWTFNKDGTYDITLDLITMGDVIESLVTNIGFAGLNTDALVSLKSNYENFKSSYQYGIEKTSFNTNPDTKLDASAESDLLIEIASTDALTNFLFSSQISLPKGVTEGDFMNIRDAAFDQYGGAIVRSVPPMKNYYVTFKTLLSFLRSNILPTVKVGSTNEPLLDIDMGEETTIVSAFLNQVSLDPRKVLINPRFSTDINSQFPKSDGETTPSIKFLGKFKKYTVVQNNVIYGKLMNLYLNTDYVINLVKSKKNSKNQVPLFELLKDICSTINESLGSLNNIEPIVKDGNVITFIDQNPIPGISKIAESLGVPEYRRTSTAINVYGYGAKTASFLKNISFNTKLSPATATMITIGASASGTKNYDASAFSKWNDGLSDRFNEEILEPEYTPSTAVAPTVDLVGNLEKNRDVLEKKIEKASYGSKLKYLNETTGVGRGSLISENDGKAYKKVVNEERSGTVITRFDEVFLGYTLPVTVNGKQTFKLFPASQYADTDQGKRNFLEAANTYYKEADKAVLQTQQNLAAALDTVKNSYEGWLVQAFGGQAKKPNNTSINVAVTVEEAFVGEDNKETIKKGEATCEGEGVSSYFVQFDGVKYFNFDEDDFYERGKKLFQEYQNIQNLEETSRTNAASNTIGFIPVEFKLDIDGMTGFQLYNSLFINQEFLPSQYPKAMKFLITSHDHKINSKEWTTTLKTISVPITEANPNIQLADQLSLSDLLTLEANLPQRPVLPPQNIGTGGTYTAAGGTFDISNPTSIDVTSPSGYPTFSVNPKTKQPQIVAGKKNKYLHWTGDVDKTPGLKRYFFDQVTKKTSVVIHHTGGWSKGSPNGAKSTSTGWQKRAIEGNFPVATQYVICQDGHIELMFNEAFWSYHASIGTQDKYTIGIELKALGYMKRKKLSNGEIVYQRFDSDGNKTEITKSNAKTRVISSLTNVEDVNLDNLFSRPVNEQGEEVTFKRYDYYQSYSPEQLQSLEKVLRGIKSRHPQIDFTYSYEQMFPLKKKYNADTANLKNRSGIYTHNTFNSKSDVFPQKELISILKRLSTELGVSQPSPDGKFYGQDGNFDYQVGNITTTGGSGTAAQTEAAAVSEAESYRNLMLDIIDALKIEAKSMSVEFLPKGQTIGYSPKEYGSEKVAGSEVNRFFYSANELKKLIKIIPDDQALKLFKDELGKPTKSARWKRKKWALINIGTNPTLRVPGKGVAKSPPGYASPNFKDSDLEEAWEGMFNRDSFRGATVDF